VAPLGTALTEGHMQQIGRFTKRIILCFDGDAAGLRAMEKGLKLALPMGFDVRLLLLPQGEDPDTWCMALGAEAFRELIRQAPDWTNFMINRSMEGKDMRRTPERMEALRDLAGYLAFLPASAEQRELFASLAHELRIPLTELDRAIQARKAAPVEVPAPAPPVAEVDDLLKPILILCKDEAFLERAAALPPAWWEALQGAPLLQCLLDASGDESHIPPEALAQLRHLEARWSVKDDAELQPEQMFMKLELGFVEREKQALNRQLQDPGVMVDPAMQARLAQSLENLLRRGRQLRVQMVEQRRKSFSR
jgi:DNA primase